MPKGIYERKSIKGRTEKKCSKCKEIKLLAEFYPSTKYVDGRQYYCKLCSNKHDRILWTTAKRKEYIAGYKKTQTFRDVRRKKNAKYIKLNPEKQKARILARKHIKPKEICEVCNINKVVHFHHPDYSKPLEVIHVCAQCHSRIHYIKRNLI